MELYEVVMKLVGPVQPIGSHGEDMARLENIRNLTELIDRLLYEVDAAAKYAARSEASMAAIGIHALNFLTEVKDA